MVVDHHGFAGCWITYGLCIMIALMGTRYHVLRDNDSSGGCWIARGGAPW